MSVAWDASALPGLIVGALDLVAALVVFAARPAAVRNRRLAVMFLGASISIGVFWGARRLLLDPADAHATAVVDWFGLLVFLWGYLGFVATLDTPWAAPLRDRRVMAAAAVTTAVLAASLLVRPGDWIRAVVRDDVFPGWDTVDGPHAAVMFAATMAAFVVGIVVATSAWRRAPTDRARGRAFGYLVAFVVHDATFLVWIVYSELLDLPGLGPRAGAWVYTLGTPLIQTVFLGLLTGAVLRHQVVGFDRVLHRAIRTTAGALVPSIVVAGIAWLAWERLGPAAGVAFAGGGTVAWLSLRRPVWAATDRLADAAFPHVEEAGHEDGRRLHVYEAALEDALAFDGTLRPSREGDLARLRRRLGLTRRDHDVLAHALIAARARWAPAVVAVGRRALGRYDVRRSLGGGGQGETFLAHDTLLHRDVVLKVMHPAARPIDDVLAEAGALAALSHPNVMTVHDVERAGDHAILVMEHLPGGSLADQISEGPLSRDAFRRLTDDLLAGVQAVHDAGLVHRDIKPSNILFTADGAAKLTDFGVAAGPDLDVTLRLGGDQLVGTVRYMSPEAARGAAPTPQSDLYSAAATLVEAATGTPLVAHRPGEALHTLAVRVAQTRPTLPDMPTPLARVFRRALDPDPTKRYASAATLRAALKRAGSSQG